jgi:hypothetical protein
MADLTQVERWMLRVLLEHGGRHAFRPQDQGQLAWAVFDREVVRVLQSLQSRGLVRIDEQASHVISLPGKGGKYAAVTAELTQGRPRGDLVTADGGRGGQGAVPLHLKGRFPPGEAHRNATSRSVR